MEEAELRYSYQMWTALWKLKVLTLFFWKLLNDSLPMQREFAKRNVIPNASYSLYASKEGSLDYLFTGKHKQAFGLPRSCLTCTDMGNGDFLENNYKTQTISLVRKRFKLICFLTIRVQRTWFLVQPDRPRRPEIELKGLALPSWKSS